MNEAGLIARLKAMASHPAARGLDDDAAVLVPPLGRDLVLTHDVLVEGVHYLSGDPPGDVAWKLVAVNLSDLAGKGAEPLGALMGFTLAGDNGWDVAFVDGLERALAHFALPLLGGDTVFSPGPRVLGLTAIGQVAAGGAPSRTDAREGDGLWVTGHIGDAGLGLKVARGELAGDGALLKRYRLPMPRMAMGRAIAPCVRAMMDVSDGLLIDAARMARASGCAIAIDLDAVPLSDSYRRIAGAERQARLSAAVAGDDYELLFSAAPQHDPEIAVIAAKLKLPVTKIGRVVPGEGLSLYDKGEIIALPADLGWEHHRPE